MGALVPYAPLGFPPTLLTTRVTSAVSDCGLRPVVSRLTRARPQPFLWGR